MTIQDTLKSKDTEEWIDLLFYRPIGYYWALFFKTIHVTPNMVSILSILLGVTAGVFFYFSDIWLNVIGMILLVWANSYDSADGQLARMTKHYSRLGRLLDGAASACWFISIYIAISLRLMPEWGFYIWVLALVAGFFHSKQTEMADYLRNFHLLFVNDYRKSEFDDTDKIKEHARHLTWKKDFMEKISMIFYVNYTKDQERWTPRLQDFRKALDKITGNKGFAAVWGNEVSETKINEVEYLDFREAFRKASKPMMKYTNILSFNTRAIALCVSVFVGLPCAYFVFELTIMNVLLIYMIYTYEAVCKKFTLRLRRND